MANYLLLRNNKKSGPHSAEDLKQLGLKAYDLVWVEGRSAAWRYPSEVEELKPFAPMGEEQPFDRFYKKKPEEKKAQVLVHDAYSPVIEELPAAVEEATYATVKEHEKYIPKKSVFVTMPGKKQLSVKPVVKEEPRIIPEPVQQTISIKENPVAAATEIKYSQPLDDIKEMYVKTLNDRKRRIARNGFLLKSLKRAAVILVLIGIGVIGGLLIKSNGNKKQEIARQENPSQKNSQGSQNKQGTDDNVAATNNPEQLVPPTGNENNSSVITGPVNDASTQALTKNPFAGNKKDKRVTVPNNQMNDPANLPALDVDPVTGERNRVTREESDGNSEAERKAVKPIDVSEQVSVKSNDYKKVAFGGIRNLELTVTNDSKYTLDNVVVELQYIKPNELPLKTEKIAFTSVGPKSTSTIKVPDTNRGIKVTYRVVQINSRQLSDLAAGN